jgi:hypothetical protein
MGLQIIDHQFHAGENADLQIDLSLSRIKDASMKPMQRHKSSA